MADIVSNIGSLEEFYHLRQNYKSISKLSQKELKFYLLNLENGNSLINLLNFLKDESNNSKIEFNFLDRDQDQDLIYLRILRKGDQDGSFPEALIHFNKKNSNILFMTDEEGTEMKIIKRFIYELFPYISKKFIKSYEIRKIISSFMKQGYNVTATMVSIKRWWEKVRTSSIEYTKTVPVEKILDDLDRNNSFIDSITFNVFDESKENKLLKAYISRSGLMKFSDGFYELFQENIIGFLSNEVEEERKLLRDRSREKETIKPLRVYFEKLRDFSPIEITKQFARSISKDRELSLAIMHNGNPYFYASVTNNSDGSVFDIVFQNIGDGSELIVIPQYSVSSNSLSKFFSLVYSKFGEGQISDYKDV